MAGHARFRDDQRSARFAQLLKGFATLQRPGVSVSSVSVNRVRANEWCACEWCMCVGVA